MAAITSTETASVFLKLVASNALTRLKANTVMLANDLINRQYEASFASAGDTITVGIPSNFPIGDLNDGDAVTRQNPTYAKTQLVLNEHKYASFAITDPAEIFTPVNVRTSNMSQMIANMAEAIDNSIISAAYAGFTFNAPVGAYGTTLTEATIIQARNALVRARTPKNAPKIMVLESGAYSNLLSIGRFTEALTRGFEQAPGGSNAFGMDVGGANGTAIAYSGVGKIHSFMVFEDQVTPITFDGSGNSQTHNIAFSPDAILFAQRKLPQAPVNLGVMQTFVEEDKMALRVTMNYNADILGSQITVDTLYGTGIGRVQFGLEVRT
jgi:hypothetical protein